MRIDKNAINKLLKQSDDQLWRTLQMIASLNGIDIAQGVAPYEHVEAALNSFKPYGQ